MTPVEDAMRDRVLRLIGRALIEISWQRPGTAAEALIEATHHLREMAGGSLDYVGPARDGIEAQHAHNDIFPGDPYPPPQD